MIYLFYFNEKKQLRQVPLYRTKKEVLGEGLKEYYKTSVGEPSLICFIIDTSLDGYGLYQVANSLKNEWFNFESQMMPFEIMSAVFSGGAYPYIPQILEVYKNLLRNCSETDFRRPNEIIRFVL